MRSCCTAGRMRASWGAVRAAGRFRRRLCAWSAAALLLGGAAATPGAVPAFALDWFGNLKTIDLVGPTVVLDGPTGLSNATLQGLAVSASNQLYAIDTAGALYSLAPNGAPSFVANTGIGATYGLDFYTANTMLAVDDLPQQTVFQITTAGVATPLVTLATPQNRIEAIATAAPTRAYALAAGALGTTDVLEVDLISGVVLPRLTLPEVCKGLDLAQDGNWYAVGYVGKTFRVDPAQGTFQQTVYTGGEDWQALAAPVPEPAGGVSLFLVGVLARGRRWRAARR